MNEKKFHLDFQWSLLLFDNTRFVCKMLKLLFRILCLVNIPKSLALELKHRPTRRNSHLFKYKENSLFLSIFGQSHFQASPMFRFWVRWRLEMEPTEQKSKFFDLNYIFINLNCWNTFRKILNLRLISNHSKVIWHFKLTLRHFKYTLTENAEHIQHKTTAAL